MERDSETAVVVLAAGLGTRMKSEKAKVLHEICGKTMLHYVLERALKLTTSDNIIVVVGCQAEAVKEEAARSGDFKFARQEQQLGTGHAVLCALDKIPANVRRVVILCGDVPFISHDTVQRLIEKQEHERSDVVLLSVRLENPTGYGRIVFDDSGKVSKIVEEADADSEFKKIKVVNAGTYCVDKSFLAWSLARINAENAQNELYLTDIISIAYQTQRSVGALIIEDAFEVTGINSPVDLAGAEKEMRRKRYLS